MRTLSIIQDVFWNCNCFFQKISEIFFGIVDITKNIKIISSIAFYNDNNKSNFGCKKGGTRTGSRVQGTQWQFKHLHEKKLNFCSQKRSTKACSRSWSGT